MCFDNDGDAEFADTRVVKVRKARRCSECREVIPVGDLAHVLSGMCDGEFFRDTTCGRCEATRHRIHQKELAEGCRWSESWCPQGELLHYLRDAEQERESAEAGQRYLASRKGCAQ